MVPMVRRESFWERRKGLTLVSGVIGLIGLCFHGALIKDRLKKRQTPKATDLYTSPTEEGI